MTYIPYSLLCRQRRDNSNNLSSDLCFFIAKALATFLAKNIIHGIPLVEEGSLHSIEVYT